jgi:toxin ParE1/3/4
MPPIRVELHPEAIEEAAAAVRWYRKRSEGAASAFEAAIDQAIDLIADAPDRWPAHTRGTRRFVMQRFPFSVIYRPRDGAVEVIAIAHASRRPAY